MQSLELARALVRAVSPLLRLLRNPPRDVTMISVGACQLSLSRTDVLFVSSERAVGWCLTISERRCGEVMKISWNTVSIDVLRFQQGKWADRLVAALASNPYADDGSRDLSFCIESIYRPRNARHTVRQFESR